MNKSLSIKRKAISSLKIISAATAIASATNKIWLFKINGCHQTSEFKNDPKINIQNLNKAMGCFRK